MAYCGFGKNTKFLCFLNKNCDPLLSKKSWINIWLQYLIMRVKIVAYKFTVYHYHSHVHYYYTHQNMLDLPWEDNSLAPKWNNKQKNVVSLNNLLKKFTYNLIYFSQTNIMSGSIKGKKNNKNKQNHKHVCLHLSLPYPFQQFHHQNTVAHVVLDKSIFLV